MSNDKVAATFHPGNCPTCGDRTIGVCCDELIAEQVELGYD